MNADVSESRVSGFDTSKIEDVTTPGGLKVWLIRAPELPMVSVELNFRSGSAFEPKGKEGVAHFTAALMDEGAGPYDAKAFRDELDDIGARFGASTDTQDLSINLTTLAEHKARAFELMGLAVREPRFDGDAVARMRDAMLADIRQGDEEPSTLAWRLFRPAVYGNHVYANSGEGTLTSVGALGADDARSWHGQGFTKANLRIAVVGDITPEELGPLLDKALGGLPEGDVRAAIAGGPEVTVPAIIRKQMDVPQGTVLLGHLGIPRTDPDFYAMLVMNEILGGGVLTSRLGADVREKHGLAYGVNSANAPLPFNGMFYVSLATGNDTVAKALELVRKHLNLIRDEPVTMDEFNDAKAYLVGSFPLRLDSNAKLMNMIAMMQTEDLPKSYLENWPQKIAAVTREDIQRVAKRVIQPGAMTLVIVGNGKALEAQ
ncbi:MAG: insulinase family protein [Alphaproteobacteria bacterium]|nr:MAG: insulinase family protein [Alphaproteobacteria bacterium]